MLLTKKKGPLSLKKPRSMYVSQKFIKFKNVRIYPKVTCT